MILFIVEGITDQDSLELLLTQLIESNSQVIFEVVGGDITSDYDINVSNIKKKLTEVVKDGRKRKFKASDYKEVIHLVDMDGTFIPEDNIYQDETASGFVYKDQGIYTNNKDRAMARNHKKKGILNLLISTSKVFGSIPYRVFYFSCNLEHVLHNERQVPDYLKIKYGEEFQDRYIEDLQGFVDLICKSDFAVKKKYKESWEFIKKDNNSIKRFSNFNILLEDYLNK